MKANSSKLFFFDKKIVSNSIVNTGKDWTAIAAFMVPAFSNDNTYKKVENKNKTETIGIIFKVFFFKGVGIVLSNIPSFGFKIVSENNGTAKITCQSERKNVKSAALNVNGLLFDIIGRMPNKNKQTKLKRIPSFLFGWKAELCSLNSVIVVIDLETLTSIFLIPIMKLKMCNLAI